MNKLTLKGARCKFTECITHLILKAIEWGYGVAFAEGLDRKTAKDPTSDHMKNSLHNIGLAQDLDIYRDGVYLNKTEDHVMLGTWWEKFGQDNGYPLRWGGRFGDGNHYSWEWEGKK